MRIELFFRRECADSREVREYIRNRSLRNRIIFHDIGSEAGAYHKLFEMVGEEESPCLAVDDRPLVGSQNIIRWLEEHFGKRRRPVQMMRRRGPGMFLLGLFALIACGSVRASDEIPVIGTDKSGHQIVKHVSRKDYVKAMAAVVSSVQEESLPALDNMSYGRKWNIRTISLGIGLDLTLGPAPIFQLEFTPRFNVYLCKGSDPIMP
jgi:hypothetical protein